MTELAQKANVLFVDDERRVLTSMRAMFRRTYNVFLANSGLEALEVLEREQVDVIVSDQRMPGMTGVEVLKAFKDNAPRAMRILLTGYADQEAIAASINEGEVFRYLTKPCPQDLLKETVALAVEAACGPVAPPTLEQPSSSPPVEEPKAPSEPQLADVMLDAAPTSEDFVDLQVSEPEREAPIALDPKDVELLVLSDDKRLIHSLNTALEQSHVMHSVQAVDEAVDVLEKHSIGVLITDIAVNADEVQELTSELKKHVPELVTIVASDHSDAHRLIDLINGGQVFRFLLKPIKAKQTSIWIESAVGKHVQLLENPELLARHVVAEQPTSALRKFGDQLVGIASRIMRFRDRSAQPNQV